MRKHRRVRATVDVMRTRESVTVPDHARGPVPAEFAPYLPPALANVNVPAYVLGADGRVRWLNAAAVALVGDVVGRPATELVDLDPRTARAIFERRIAGRDERDHTVTVLDPDGKKTRVDISSVPLGREHRIIGMFGLAVRRDPGRRHTADGPLTLRQQEVLQLLADGASTQAIAESLFLSEETVRNHIRRILKRLNANSRLLAVAIARRDGLV